jgi:hypothetical protein
MAGQSGEEAGLVYYSGSLFGIFVSSVGAAALLLCPMYFCACLGA